jgi:3-methyladenine DNA glycosylase AlkD
MENEKKRLLKKLGNKHFAENIKLYIKSPYKFYETKVPEIKVLAKRLHEEHSLKEFYKVFDRLWESGYHEEMSLAIYTLESYEEDLDLSAWNFIKPKLNEIKSADQIDAVALNIVGKIMLKHRKLENEILSMSKSKNFWLRRLAIISTIPKAKEGDSSLTVKIAEKFIKDKEPYVQKATGYALKEIGSKNPKIAKEFILEHLDMPLIIFNNATENMKELRKIRRRKMKTRKRRWFFARFFTFC